MWPQINYAAIELKDVLTISIAVAALLTSVSTTTLNVMIQRRQKREDAKAAFAEAILGIAGVREKIDELRHELGEEYHAAKNTARRITLFDQRTFYISKALQILSNNSIRVSSFESLLLAAALIDSGQVGQSIRYYSDAVMTASDDYDRASARRVYGRAKIMLGEYESGRREMLSAISTFQKISSMDAYDTDRMKHEIADTYLRLLYAETNKGVTKDVDDDKADFMAAIREIKDPMRRLSFENRYAELFKPQKRSPKQRKTTQ